MAIVKRLRDRRSTLWRHPCPLLALLQPGVKQELNSPALIVASIGPEIYFSFVVMPGHQRGLLMHSSRKERTPVCKTPLHDKIAMATPCQYVRNTTALTHRNLDTGLMGASSYLVPW